MPRILIASGFFESELISFREYAYSRGLAGLGHDVTLMAGDQSYIWSRSRTRLPTTNPMRRDAEFVASTGVRLLRRHVFVRISDFVLYLPNLSAIRNADLVHVIEFRTGITVLIALLARAMGKPVIYDHEQRGDRDLRWYSKLDSKFRRALIHIGSLTPDTVRHTILANRDHFRSSSARDVPTMLAPLGADTSTFYYDENERKEIRREFRIGDGERLAVTTGKLHRPKHIVDVVRACRRTGTRLMLVGTVASDLATDLAALGPGPELFVPQVSPSRLRAIFNAADCAIFTTFTVSYWEAHATGLPLILPATDFTKIVLEGDPLVFQFGGPELFSVSDEQYRDGINITNAVAEALARIPATVLRSSRNQFSAEATARSLSELYRRVLATRAGRSSE